MNVDVRNPPIIDIVGKHGLWVDSGAINEVNTSNSCRVQVSKNIEVMETGCFSAGMV